MYSPATSLGRVSAGLADDVLASSKRALRKRAVRLLWAAQRAILTQSCNCTPFQLIRKLPPPRAAACPRGRRGLRADQQLVLSVGSLGSEGSHTPRLLPPALPLCLQVTATSVT